jgi:hypothetical protein
MAAVSGKLLPPQGISLTSLLSFERFLWSKSLVLCQCVECQSRIGVKSRPRHRPNISGGAILKQPSTNLRAVQHLRTRVMNYLIS